MGRRFPTDICIFAGHAFLTVAYGLVTGASMIAAGILICLATVPGLFLALSGRDLPMAARIFLLAAIGVTAVAFASPIVYLAGTLCASVALLTEVELRRDARSAGTP